MKIKIFLVISLLLTQCHVLQTETIEEKTKRNLASKDENYRRQGIKYVTENRLERFLPELREIIYNPNYHELERYLAAKSLATLLKTRAAKEILLFLNQKDPILQNSGMEILLYLLKKRYYVPDSQKISFKILDILKSKPSKITSQKACISLGLLKYEPAYPFLIKKLKKRQWLFDEHFISIALLGNEKRNPEIRGMLLTLDSETQDKRLKRSIRKALYIIINHNESLPIFEGRLMEKLTDLGSDYFSTALGAEKFFLLHQYKEWTDLKKQFGENETYDPKKIERVEKDRIPLLIFALRDHNPKIRFKAAKILGLVGNTTSCSALKKMYERDKNSRVLSKIALLSIAQVNCPDSLPLLEQRDKKKRKDSPLFVWIQNNPSYHKTHPRFFLNNALLYSQEETFPEELTYILPLLSHSDNRVRINALYSLYKSKSDRKTAMIKKRLEQEKDPEIRSFIIELLGYEKNLDFNRLNP